MIKYFLKRTSLLLLTFTAIIVGIFILTYAIFHSKEYSISKEKNILILGDSHPECAIDDRIFSRSMNLSRSGTAYPFTYIKLKKFISDNPQIDTLLLSVSVHSFVCNNHEWLNGAAFRERVREVIYISDFEDWRFLFGQHSFLFCYSALRAPLMSCLISLKAIISGREQQISDFGFGGFVASDRNKLEEDPLLLSKRPALHIDSTVVSYEYFEKIIDFCKEHEIAVVLFETPIYQGDRYFPQEELRTCLLTHFPDIPYADYSNFPLPDSCYGDVAHLNKFGAKVFSEYLQKEGINNYNK